MRPFSSQNVIETESLLYMKKEFNKMWFSPFETSSLRLMQYLFTFFQMFCRFWSLCLPVRLK